MDRLGFRSSERHLQWFRERQQNSYFVASGTLFLPTGKRNKIERCFVAFGDLIAWGQGWEALSERLESRKFGSRAAKRHGKKPLAKNGEWQGG